MNDKIKHTRKGTITIGSGKGGCGKTTVTTNLAAALATAGFSVMIVDCDSQPHSSGWGSRRAEERYKAGVQHDITSVVKFGKIGMDVYDLSKRYDFVLIDVGGREGTELRQALAVSDLHILPMRPSDYDTWTIADLQETLDGLARNGVEVDSRVLINSAPANPMMKDAAMFRKDLLSNFENLKIMDTVLCERVVYRRPVRQGKCAIDFATLPQFANENGITEIKELFKEITGFDWAPANAEEMTAWGMSNTNPMLRNMSAEKSQMN